VEVVVARKEEVVEVPEVIELLWVLPEVIVLQKALRLFR